MIRTFNYEIPDRVPINYMYNPGIDQRLKAYFGLQPTDDEGLRQALGVDFRVINAPYTGPPSMKPVPDRKLIRSLVFVRAVCRMKPAAIGNNVISP